MSIRTAIVIPYFNPAGYRSHRGKLQECLATFGRLGLAEHVYLAGAGRDRPRYDNTVYWDDNDTYLWHKERLINLAAARLPARYTHVIWSDSDVMIDATWADAVSEAFAESPVVQCFETAVFKTADGARTRAQPSYLRAGQDGRIGLMWGAHRSLFASGPGLFELALVGGGDTVFGVAVLQGDLSPSAPWCAPIRTLGGWIWSEALFAAADRWQADLDRWLGRARPVAARTTITVIEHGSITDRAYVDRNRLLADVEPDRHLIDESGHVLRWSPCGAAAIEPGIRAYFHSRREDDRDGGVMT
jgi:hypothetical protein